MAMHFITLFCFYFHNRQSVEWWPCPNFIVLHASVRIFHGIVKLSSSWVTKTNVYSKFQFLPYKSTSNKNSKYRSEIPVDITRYPLVSLPFPEIPSICLQKFQFLLLPVTFHWNASASVIPISNMPYWLVLSTQLTSHQSVKLQSCNKSVANFIALTSLPFLRSSCHVSLSIRFITSLGSLDTNPRL